MVAQITLQDRCHCPDREPEATLMPLDGIGLVLSQVSQSPVLMLHLLVSHLNPAALARCHALAQKMNPMLYWTGHGLSLQTKS